MFTQVSIFCERGSLSAADVAKMGTHSFSGAKHKRQQPPRITRRKISSVDDIILVHTPIHENFGFVRLFLTFFFSSTLLLARSGNLGRICSYACVTMSVARCSSPCSYVSSLSIPIHSKLIAHAHTCHSQKWPARARFRKSTCTHHSLLADWLAGWLAGSHTHARIARHFPALKTSPIRLSIGSGTPAQNWRKYGVTN